MASRMQLREYGAEEGTRTLNSLLGRQELYHCVTSANLKTTLFYRQTHYGLIVELRLPPIVTAGSEPVFHDQILSPSSH